MRFTCIDAWKDIWPVEFLCRVMQVTSRGFWAWKVRPMSPRQRDNMVILAHLREQHRLSLQSYGRPHMTEELQEMGLNVGHRRVGRLMQANGIKIVRTRKYKATTDSNPAFNIALNLLEQDLSANEPNQKWAGDISCIWTGERRLSNHGFLVSMSGKGNCYDNSMVETFFNSLKAEGAIFQYINGFFNPRLRHSAWGGKSPLAFEKWAA